MEAGPREPAKQPSLTFWVVTHGRVYEKQELFASECYYD